MCVRFSPSRVHGPVPVVGVSARVGVVRGSGGSGPSRRDAPGGARGVPERHSLEALRLHRPHAGPAARHAGGTTHGPLTLLTATHYTRTVPSYPFINTREDYRGSFMNKYWNLPAWSLSVLTRDTEAIPGNVEQNNELFFRELML